MSCPFDGWKNSLSVQSCQREEVVFVICLLIKHRVFNDSEAISYPKDILGENMHGSISWNIVID